MFTVVFQRNQTNSYEHNIVLSEDHIYEGSEYFRLRIVAVRFKGDAADLFRVEDGLYSTSVDVLIEDNDCKFRM